MKIVQFLCAEWYNAAKRAECMAETIDAIAMLDTIIVEHPNHSIIIGGDINSELRGESPFDPLWEEFMTKFGLMSCDHFLPPTSFTYYHESLDHKKWNDHFLVRHGFHERSV